MDIEGLHFKPKHFCMRCAVAGCRKYAFGRCLLPNGKLSGLICREHLNTQQPDDSKHITDCQDFFWLGVNTYRLNKHEFTGGVKP